jgi:tape measure domain-containing protein
MADVNIVVDIAAKGAVKQLDKIEEKFEDIEKDAKKAGKETDKSLKLISKGAAAAAVAVTAIGAGIIAAVDQASKLQDLETQFIAFTGSAEGAAEQVERIAEFSGETPFQLEELVTANRTLLAFGQSTEQSIETLNQLGEAAAGTGANINDLALIFGQIEAAGKLTGERFNQLAERGVNLGPALAEGLGVAESELEDLRRQGKITSDDVLKALESMTTGSGQFAGSMERLSLTFSGATSTLQDNASLLASDFGKLLLPAVTGFTVALTDSIKFVREFTKETKADRVQAFNSQIETAERNIAGLAQQAQAAGEGGILFSIFSGGADPKAELKRINGELALALGNLEELKKKRDATEARPESDFDDPTGGALDSTGQERIENARKISAEIEEIARLEVANREARAAATNAKIAEQLDAQLEIIKEKELEKQVALLESQGLFEEAQQLQAQENLRKLEEAEQASLEKRKDQQTKAQKDQFNFEKKTAAAELKFQQQTWEQRAKTSQAGLAALASLQATGSKTAFEIGKAAAIAQALVSIPSTAIKAYESLAGIPVVGPGLGAAAAAAAVAAGTAQINKIRSTKFTAMQDGGLVEGGIPGVDSVPILAQQGEVVVPRKDFSDLDFNNDRQVTLLNEIKDLLNTISLNTEPTEDAVEPPPLSVELTLDGEVLANQILELNQDNARIA